MGRDGVELPALSALAQELGFWLDTAAQDKEHAAAYVRSAPPLGLPAEAYLELVLDDPHRGRGYGRHVGRRPVDVGGEVFIALGNVTVAP
jgi:hypothetical protein